MVGSKEDTEMAIRIVKLGSARSEGEGLRSSSRVFAANENSKTGKKAGLKIPAFLKIKDTGNVYFNVPG